MTTTPTPSESPTTDAKHQELMDSPIDWRDCYMELREHALDLEKRALTAEATANHERSLYDVVILKLATAEAALAEAKESAKSFLCAYCRKQLPKNHEAISDHIMVCEFHPVRLTLARIDALESALAAERTRHEWQPISTLPRDSTPVLVWASPMHAPDIAWHDGEGTTLRTYTHWQPLPLPPTESGSKSADAKPSPCSGPLGHPFGHEGDDGSRFCIVCGLKQSVDAPATEGEE